jgi:hypothetical protein
MRTLALAAVFGVGLLAGGIAAAEQFSDPSGRLTFNAPSGWRVQPRNNASQTVVLAFNPTNDCYFFGVNNPATASASPEAVHNTRDPLPASAWVTAASPIHDFFDGSPATLVSQSVDTSGFWPVQRAELRGPSKTVFGAILARPGVEIRAFCSGATSASTYDSIFASLGHPNDAAWQQAASEQRTSREARQTTAVEAQEAAQEEQTEEQQQSAFCNDPTIPSRDPRRRRCGH